MDRRDEELTIENVDERVEELVQPHIPQPPATLPLARTIHDLRDFYEEERRLQAIWERVNSLATVAPTDHPYGEADAPNSNGRPFPTGRKAKQVRGCPDVGSLNSVPHGLKRQPRSSRRWRNLGVGLVAALLLIVILAWPAFSLVFHHTPTIGSQPPVPTGNGLAMKVYTNQYFTIQYPANWTIADVTTDSTSVQTVHFRPVATNAVEISVAVLPASSFSKEQLLHEDPDVQRGTLVSTNTVIYNGIPWAVDLVNLTSSTQASLGKLKVAYCNQKAPYKIEFAAPLDLFAKYAAVFDNMLSSFHSQTQPQSAVTPTVTSPPAFTPSPTKNVPGMKMYSSQYFKIQYPANWVVTSTTTGGGYLQTVQFRPSAQSAVFFNVNVLHSSLLSGYLLLQLDPDVGLGALLNTSTVTLHGIPWATALVNVAGSAQAQPSQMEIAYSNQKMPYRIEFSAPPDLFAAYSTTFNTLFTSFYPAN